MGMNPRRSGGSVSYALTQHGLNTVSDVYGANTALLAPDGIVRGAAGAPSSGLGSKMVTAVPPSLRGPSSGTQQPSSVASIPILGPLMNNLPGGTGIHLVIIAVIVFFGLRLLMKAE